jgi:hypothetical protein
MTLQQCVWGKSPVFPVILSGWNALAITVVSENRTRFSSCVEEEACGFRAFLS